MKVHRNVTVLEVADPVLRMELEAATRLNEVTVRRISDTAVVHESDRL